MPGNGIVYGIKKETDDRPVFVVYNVIGSDNYYVISVASQRLGSREQYETPKRRLACREAAWLLGVSDFPCWLEDVKEIRNEYLGDSSVVRGSTGIGIHHHPTRTNDALSADTGWNWHAGGCKRNLKRAYDRLDASVDQMI
jgi:hypothetical protein